MALQPACELCTSAGGVPVAEGRRWRVIRAVDTDFPAFYRLVWTEHVAEFSDLEADDRAACMEAVTRIERALRETLRPTKVNLATLGNVVPHLHWHVIARFDWDSHFPQPVWGQRQREVNPSASERLGVSLDALDAAVRAAVAES
jgi:diadenosine tetraphosphate (Ap4A) HIT family hydrolase